MLDLQTRSMQDNLIFTGIFKNSGDDPEKLVKDFMKTWLTLPLVNVDNDNIPSSPQPQYKTPQRTQTHGHHILTL